MTFFLGIDGGGTKTRCVLGDENSALGTGSSSSCKVQRVGEDYARDALTAAIHEACVQAGISSPQIARTCAGVTGAGRSEVANIMREIISGIVEGEVRIVGDVEIAFEDAFGAAPGVIVIAGTGSIAYGRNPKGETARTGGWGHAISDEGSGYWIGVKAVRVGLRARDEGKDSALLTELMAAFGTKDFEEFVVHLNADPAPDFASLFPVVLSAATRPPVEGVSDPGNKIANHVLKHAGNELAKLAETVIRRLFRSEKVCIATHGGVLTSSEEVRNSFCKHLESLCPQVSYSSKAIDPAQGALALARREFRSTATL